MKKHRIIKATQDRMAEVAKVFRRSYRNVYPNFPELHTAEEDKAFFTNIVFPKNSVYLAQDVKTAGILGFIAFHRDWIEHLYIVPESEKRGIGSELIALAKSDSEKLQLWTFQQNNGARAFYKKHGFAEIETTDGSENEEKQPDVLLEWIRSR